MRHGGRVEKGADGVERFVIPVRRPVPDAFVPSWKAPAPAGARYTEAEMAQVRAAVRIPFVPGQDSPDPTVRVQKALDALAPGWTTSRNAPDMKPGFVASAHTAGFGEVQALVRTHPPRRGEAVTLSRTLRVPEGNPTLHFEVAASPGGDFRLVVRVDGCALLKTDVAAAHGDGLRLVPFDLSLEPWAGKTVAVELLNEPTGWLNEAALWRDIRITANTGL